jgi:hypothetical protein
MLIRWTAMQAIGHWDAFCDLAGGMEDIHGILEMCLAGNFESSMLNLDVPLKVNVNHNQAVKEAREFGALKAIVAHMRAMVRDFPEVAERVEAVLRKYELSDI